jgi:CheY-like chemotaxis protein
MIAVAVTAHARPKDRVRALQAGYQWHLPKPLEPAELVSVIASLLSSENGPQGMPLA